MNSEKWKGHEDINSIEDPIERIISSEIKANLF